MNPSVDQQNKATVWSFWQRLNHLAPGELRNAVETALHPEISWFGPQPINEISGIDSVLANYLEPLVAAFPDCRRECDVFLGAESAGEHWVSACGYLIGTFVCDWLGIPATGNKTYIHFGEHLRVEDGLIVEGYLLLDVLGVARQAGFQLLPPAPGAEGGKLLPPPKHDGVLLTEQDPLESRTTRQLVSAMLEGLYRGRGHYKSMEMENYWHPDMHWYGPTGIGSCYSLAQFEEFHQVPWMSAFPDHSQHTDASRIIGLEAGEILAEGQFAALGVWDCPFSVHRGMYLGAPPTGKTITMRDFDWYRRDGRYLVQNWVPIDMIDLMLQLGVDLIERLAYERELRESGMGSSALEQRH